VLHIVLRCRHTTVVVLSAVAVIDPTMRIRDAITADVPAMLAAHRAAVQRTAAGFYDSAVIARWSAGSDLENVDATIACMQRNLTSGEVVGFVAEDSGEVIGFGELVPAQCQLGAIYVHPDHGRKGVGAALLRAIEAAAQDRGLAELHMDASLNAEAFYHRHGFEVVAYAKHTMRDGLSMACVKMRKAIGA
jgi:putative acetyltransferase